MAAHVITYRRASPDMLEVETNERRNNLLTNVDDPMTSAALADYYQSRAYLETLNPLIRSAYNTGTDYTDYKHKVLAKPEGVPDNASSTLANSLEEMRREQRARLAQMDQDYLHLRPTQSFDVPLYSPEIELKPEPIVTSKPPLPTSIRRSPSPVFVPHEHTHHHVHHHHEEPFDFIPSEDETICSERDLSNRHVHHQIHQLWNEFELDDYLEERKPHRRPSVPSNDNWAGRVTVPDPFPLTNSLSVDNIHRRKCMHDIEAAKIQKEVDDEMLLSRSFKATPVPAHVRMPLYEQLKEEQRVRRENVRHMTKEYLQSISKPFGFEERQRMREAQRRHSFSGGETVRQRPQFRAKPVPDFYYRTRGDIEEMKETSLYRSIKKQVRAKELLRQSRLPSSMQARERHMKHTRRSMSATDMTRTGLEECTFKPKTNGYYIPNYDRLHARFLRETDRARHMRQPTQCEPFLLHTSMIPSRYERVVEDMRNDQEARYLQSFHIKGKRISPKSASGMHLSANLQQPEAIPIKSTDIQRLRETMGKSRRRDHEVRTKFEERFQRTRSARERRLKEGIQERAKLNDKSAVYRAQKEASTHKARQTIQSSEDDYARTLNAMHNRVDRRPLQLEQHPKSREARRLEQEIQHAMSVAKITERDLMRERFNPSNVKVTRVRTVDSP